MNKKFFIIMSIVALFVPLAIIGIVYLTLKINIFDNPDFWYGYMAYFGTVSLAVVSLWQNEVLKKENDKSHKRLETIHKEANEINTVNKILEFEHTRIHNLYSYLDEFEKACYLNNIIIALHGCVNEKIIITQTIEKCDFLFLAVTRELRVDMRDCKIKDELFESCSKLYNAAVNLLEAYDTNKLEAPKREKELSENWEHYFTIKEKYINSVQKDFQKLLYADLSLEEIRNIYYNVELEEK